MRDQTNLLFFLIFCGYKLETLREKGALNLCWTGDEAVFVVDFSQVQPINTLTFFEKWEAA